MTFRAIFFDVGETLWHAPSPPPVETFRALAAGRAQRYLEAHGQGHLDPAAVARIAWRSIETAMAEARKSDLREPDYPVFALSALAAAGIRLSPELTAGLLDSIYVSGAEGGKQAYPGAAETLRLLKGRGFRLATVTNRAFGGERFRCDLREADLDPGWDAHAISVEVGYLKPHPAAFEYALSELSVAPAEVLMVGNSLREDIAGAQSLGIRTAWKRCQPDARNVTPEFTFDEVSELLELPGLEEADG